jgi:hypothetical protein
MKELQMSDDAASAQIIEPTKKEKTVLSLYCALSLQCKKIEADASAKTKDLKPLLKDLRTGLMESLKESQQEILLIPIEIRKQADTRLASLGLPSIPPYIRLVKNNKDLSISSAIIEESIVALNAEDIMESETKNGKEALIECIMASVRRLIRSFSEQIKLCESVPRGIKAADVEHASAELCEEAIRLHETTSKISLTESQKRDSVSETKRELAAKISTVQEFFDRSNITHQRVILENNPYNLCKRISVVKSKVTLAALTEIVGGSIEGKLNKKEDAVKLLADRTALTKMILTKMSLLPVSTKVTIHLQKVAAAKE